jgi:hypothetical protein
MNCWIKTISQNPSVKGYLMVFTDYISIHMLLNVKCIFNITHQHIKLTDYVSFLYSSKLFTMMSCEGYHFQALERNQTPWCTYTVIYVERQKKRFCKSNYHWNEPLLGFYSDVRTIYSRHCAYLISGDSQNHSKENISDNREEKSMFQKSL